MYLIPPAGLPPTAQPQQPPYLIPSAVVGPNGPIGAYYPGVMAPSGRNQIGRMPAVSTYPICQPVGSLAVVGAGGGGSVSRDGVVLSSGGFSAAGTVVGDNFRLGFTLGNNPFVVDRFGYCQSIINCGNICGETVVCTPRGTCAYPFYYYPYYGYGYGSNYGYSGQIIGSYARVDNYAVDPFVGMGAPGAGGQSAAPSMQTPARPMTTLERGDFLLRDGLAREAIEAFKDHLKANPGDADVIRHYALALLVDRQPAEAAATMMLAYERDVEKLGPLPLDPSLGDGFSGEIRGLVNAAVTHANATRSASAWLIVAVLMQAEGRNDVALRQIEKAKAVGLSREIAVVLEKALRAR